MRRTAYSLVGLGVALVGLALAFLYAPLGVGLSFAGTFVALPMSRVNTPMGRAAYYAALFCYCGAVYVGSGSLALALVPAPVGLAMCPTEFLMGLGPVVTLRTPLAGFVLSLVAVAFAWPVGVWGFAVAPALIAVVPVRQMLKILSGDEAFTARPRPLKVGQSMPALSLPRRDGAGTFDLEAERGHFVLLCFLRGDWCPMCHVMMRLFRREAPRLARHNVHLVSISPDGGPAAQEFARDLGLDYTMLVDEESKVAASLAILDPAASDVKPFPMPVCLLIDPDGVLRFVSRPHDFSSFVDESKVISLVEGGKSRAA
jgi:peroxiredoxin